VDLSLSASISFDKCFQRNRLFQNFLAEFISLAKKCKKTKEQKVKALKKKVSKSIAKALSTLDAQHHAMTSQPRPLSVRHFTTISRNMNTITKYETYPASK
jgi:hypothetical protein